MKNQTPLKRIRLTHAHNVRDLGGITTKENKLIRWNKLYRADSLTLLEPQEWDILLDRGIHTVVDLRSSSESAKYPDQVPSGMRWVHCPIQKEQVDLKEFSENALQSFSDSLKDGYATMMTSHPDLLICALRAILQGLDQGAVLFHCSAGKDRTGIVAAVLLQLLGADQEDIIADYQVSHTYNQQGINKLARQFPQYEKIEPLLHSNPENMERLLEVFKEIDLPHFLRIHGITEEELKKLAALMLEE